MNQLNPDFYNKYPELRPQRAEQDITNNLAISLEGVNEVQAHIKAGKLKRWHTEFTIQQQTISDHVYNMFRIYTHIWGTPSPETYLRLIYHDFEEHIIGDIPHWASHMPEMSFAKEKAEVRIHDIYKGYPCDPCPCEERIKICDWIEALEFMVSEVKLGNSSLQFKMEKLQEKLHHLIKNRDDVHRIDKYLNDSNLLYNLDKLTGGE